MNLTKLSASILITVLFASVCAQTALPTKPFEQWSKTEAEKVLNDSNWTMKQELRLRFDKEVQKAAGSYSGVSGSAAAQSQTEVTSDLPVDFIFTLRLRSALPIRQAIVRLRNLETDIEKMNQSQMAAFDKQSKGLLECPACQNNYVVTLSSKSTNSPGADAVFNLFKGAQQADLERYIFLTNDRGERRPLIHFVPPKVPGDEATFFFPRLDDRGQPLLTETNKQLVVNLNDNRPTSVGNFQFDVSRLILKGKLEF
ncbi:MAG: hypothetical protein C5B55_14770 [Blastocatellia bacterium]|nr:MAG: hypothetical protein C5B55_14770 [Blastocatellia bacterium]